MDTPVQTAGRHIFSPQRPNPGAARKKSRAFKIFGTQGKVAPDTNKQIFCSITRFHLAMINNFHFVILVELIAHLTVVLLKGLVLHVEEYQAAKQDDP